MLAHHCSRHRIITLLTSILLFSLLVTTGGMGDAEPAIHDSETPSVADSGLDTQLETISTGEAVRIRDVALSNGQTTDLQLERFDILSENTRFVVGSASGEDQPLAYDPKRVKVFRGHVPGNPGSHAFIASTPGGTLGYVESSQGRRHWVNTLKDSSKVLRSGALPPSIGLCGSPVDNHHSQGGVAGQLPPAPSANRNQIVELAIETDYEFFTLFGDLDAAGDYVVALYSAISDIYTRDVDTTFELTFVRLWDSPDDLFNEPDPLVPFREYWNENMEAVQRDVAQFLSGRRDLPYGGIAYLSALCDSFGYSVVGYVLGYFPDPSSPDPYHYDIFVAAHELGHNFGAQHTHFYEIDTCDQLDGDPQRGTIMSYCSQTVSGGNANTDLRFHSDVQGVMENYLSLITCPTPDCNYNGIHDLAEIIAGDVMDSNNNLIPDECEDCNNNGVIDEQDIAEESSSDINNNGLPDECEPDCNQNNIPDSVDINFGASQDIYGNTIPDECDPDCNTNGTADYNEIQADMSLDLDRNAVLDSCQDCDGDGTDDFATLDGAYNAWVASYDDDQLIREFHAASGAPVSSSAAGLVEHANDLIISADKRILVSSSSDDRIVEFDNEGIYVGDFVSAGSGGLDEPAAMTFGPDGNLYVASRGSDSVLVYDGVTGIFIDEFVTNGLGSLTQPFGITFGADGHLYVTSAANEVLQYSGATGDFLNTFVSAADNGGLDQPRTLLFKPNGNLLVASFATNEVLEYDSSTGDFLTQFNNGGTDEALTFDGPWALRIGPNGNLFASRHLIDNHHDTGGGLLDDDIVELHVNSSRIYEFDITTGIFIRSYVLGNDTNLDSPTGFDFMPGENIDCNFNLLPDSCDIASGRSADTNGNNVPDECEQPTDSPDLNGDGTVDGADLGMLLGNWGGSGLGDLNSDGTVDGSDLGVLLGAWQQ